MQYTINDTWQDISSDAGTIYNCGPCDLEVSAEDVPVNGAGILLRSGTTLQHNKAVKVRAYNNDETGKINVESFRDAASGEGSGGGSDYKLPTATQSRLGGIIVGDGLSILTNGTLSVKDASTTQKGIVQVGDGLSIKDGKLTADSVADATKDKKGVVQIGDNINVSNGTISVGKATKDALGVVKVGNNLNVAVDGTISAPITSKMGLGVAKIGDHIDVVNDGTISVPTATTSKQGVVQIGDNISVSSGTISVADASTTKKGVVQIGDGLKIDDNGKLTVDGSTSVEDATTTKKGVVKIGDNISVTDGTISVGKATTDKLGVVKIGDNIRVDDGTISTHRTPYFFPNNNDYYKADGNDAQVGDIAIYYTGSAYGVMQCKSIGSDGKRNWYGKSWSVDYATANKPGTLTVKSQTQGGTGALYFPSNGSPYIDAHIAASDTYGVVKIGDNINVTDGTISVGDATTTTKGVVKVGDNISVSSGTISVKDASTTQKGVVQIGDGLKIDDNGKLTVDGGSASVSDASKTTKGVVKVGDNISVTDGTISVPAATGAEFGVVKINSDTGGFTNLNGYVSAYPTTDVWVGGLNTLENATNYPRLYKRAVWTTPTGDSDNGNMLFYAPVGTSGTWTPIDMYRYKATTTQRGCVIPGTNISFEPNTSTISVSDASKTIKGVVQIGDGLKIDENGKLTLDLGDNYLKIRNGKLVLNTDSSGDSGGGGTASGEDVEHLFYDFVPATGTYVAGTKYYTDAHSEKEVDTTGFVEGVTDVSSYYVKRYL